MKRTVISVSLLFDDGSLVRFEGLENGHYVIRDNWKEGEIKGKAIEKWIAHNVQWTSDRVKCD